MLNAPLLGSAALVLLAVPGAAWLAGFEFGAGRQLPSAESGAMVRFLRASLGAHAALSPASLLLVVWALRDAPGAAPLDGGVATAVLTPLLVLAIVVGLYAAAPFVAGSWSGHLVRRDGVGLGMAAVEQARERWPWLSKWIPEPSRGRLHPYAWDYLFSRMPALYVRARLRSGRWVGGYYGEHETRALAAYATSYPERPEVLLTHRIAVDAQTGDWPLDDEGNIVVRRDEGLLLSGDRIEHLKVAYPYTGGQDEEDADGAGPEAGEEALATSDEGLSER